MHAIIFFIFFISCLLLFVVYFLVDCRVINSLQLFKVIYLNPVIGSNKKFQEISHLTKKNKKLYNILFTL